MGFAGTYTEYFVMFGELNAVSPVDLFWVVYCTSLVTVSVAGLFVE